MKNITPEYLIETEEMVKELFRQKKIRHMIHLSCGNEKQLINIFNECVNSEDWVFTTHRSHYHALLKGMPREKLLYEVQHGGSMHLYDAELKIFSSSIVGGILPIAMGVAYGIKTRKDNNKVVVFLGDMCAEMGIFHECQKYSQRHNLPILFIIEDNALGIETKTQEAWGTEKGNKNTIRYNYDRRVPHCGIGEWVNFDV